VVKGLSEFHGKNEFSLQHTNYTFTA